MTAQRRAALARLVNILVPGGGLILLGAVWRGLLIGVVFTLLADFALLATLLIPDDVPGWARVAAVVGAVAVYALAQLRVEQYVHRRRRDADHKLRRAALLEARARLEEQAFEAALAALAPIMELSDHDLLVAYRIAQALTGAERHDAALDAWRRVQVLDVHHIYRTQREDQLRRLDARNLDAGA